MRLSFCASVLEYVLDRWPRSELWFRSLCELLALRISARRSRIASSFKDVRDVVVATQLRRTLRSGGAG